MRSSQAVTADGPASTAHLPRPDPAHGVFETLLVVDGAAIELDAHLARLAGSVRELFGAATVARIAGPARALVEARAREAGRHARLRLTVAPNRRGALDLHAEATAMNSATPLETPMPLALEPIAIARGLGSHKWADRRLLDAAEAPLDGAVPLIVDLDGSVLETARANVFAVLDGRLVTPAVDGRLLPGVSRATVLALARVARVEAVEQVVSLAEAEAADELFLTGSIRGVEPVASIGGAARPTGGPVTTRLAELLRARWIGD
jgi:para-aminobenzoate synthetase / 4-amino-4-deoxychorismate lyase